MERRHLWYNADVHLLYLLNVVIIHRFFTQTSCNTYSYYLLTVYVLNICAIVASSLHHTWGPLHWDMYDAKWKVDLLFHYLWISMRIYTIVLTETSSVQCWCVPAVPSQHSDSTFFTQAFCNTYWNSYFSITFYVLNICVTVANSLLLLHTSDTVWNLSFDPLGHIRCRVERRVFCHHLWILRRTMHAVGVDGGIFGTLPMCTRTFSAKYVHCLRTPYIHQLVAQTCNVLYWKQSWSASSERLRLMRSVSSVCSLFCAWVLLVLFTSFHFHRLRSFPGS